MDIIEIIKEIQVQKKVAEHTQERFPNLLGRKIYIIIYWAWRKPLIEYCRRELRGYYEQGPGISERIFGMEIIWNDRLQADTVEIVIKVN